MTVKGRVAIVTGAAQGIGQGYAEALAKAGAKVAVVDLKEDKAQRVVATINDTGGDAIAIKTDVSNQASVQAMAEQTAKRFGGIDILVTNAAIYEGYINYTWMELPLDYWQKFLDVNLTSVLLCVKAVVPYLIKRGGGRIITQSSDAAATCRNQYGLTKLGVNGLTIGLSKELGKHNITVNCISPGPTDTQATRDLHPTMLQQMQAQGAIKRLGTPQDHAQALLYLAADEAGWMTGQIIHVNGGWTVRPL